MEKKKVLVVFFSATGNTKQTAQKLARIVEADLCEIVPAQPYTSADLDWNDKRSRSSVEMAHPQSRPAIKSISNDIKKYDCIFLGYPIWWDLAPRAVNTFIESNELTGKTVVPFATSGGSSITNSVAALKKTYPALKWKEGRLLNHADEKSSIQQYCFYPSSCRAAHGRRGRHINKTTQKWKRRTSECAPSRRWLPMVS